jgi:pimeloyl-ACP methyl ester carboxylesterase
LDWHGPSADDAWGTVSAFASILEMSSEWKPWAITPEKVVIIGHSNGGQGTWYHAARHPDRVVASKKNFLLALWHGPNEHVIVIPAAGFIKAQAYVPLTHSR